MVIITYIFKDFWGTEYFKQSVDKFGYELAVNRTTDNPAQVIRALYECYKRAETGHETFVYADAADSIIQCPLPLIPNDRIIYQTEKKCFPFENWANNFSDKSRWRYLNGGGYCGSTKLIVEFFETYGLWNIGNKNPQAAQQEAYIEAVKDGFPIELDTKCEIFQSIAFESKDEYKYKDGLLHNKITKTIPSILHGNGRTDMKHIYNLVTKTN
jgi:hypothetical protein